jgi:hypothetical protein
MRGNWWAGAALLLVLLGQVILFGSLSNQSIAGHNSDDLSLNQGPVEPPSVGDSPSPFENHDDDIEFAPYRAFTSSEEPTTGVLDPATVEQSGYASSGNVSARTDTMSNLAYDLPLDEVHNWIASEAEVSIWNLTKVYAVNGTFEEGVPGTNVNPNGTVTYHPLGWDVYSNTTNAGQVQMAAFDSTGRSYITADNQGAKVGQNEHGHYQDTRILWTQFVDNAPYTQDFILSFDYFYLRGPIDKNTTYPITGNCSITVFAGGNPIWNMSLLTLDRRGVWESSGELPITVTGISGDFDFEIGLVIDETLVLDKRWDYDTDGAPDGIGNAAYITAYLDDVSFIKATPPTPSQVELEFTRGTDNVAVTGTSGSGSAVITNESYWQTSPVSVVLSSNTSVSFDYKTRLLSHRFTNSNSEIDISQEGVAYAAQFGISPDLTLFTYIGFLGDYENPGLRVEYPIDWENATVLDPFLSDVTSQCSLGSGFFDVPGHLLDRLGWWKFTLQSPNYAISLTPQIDDGSWLNETLYRSGNKTRALIEIGTPLTTPASFDSVNVSWILPNGTFWFDETLDDGVDGEISSSPVGLGALNTSAGEWSVEVSWTNGTEVAYDVAVFEVHHAAKLTPLEIHIVTESGSAVMNYVFYQDAENNESLMDPSASILANWSGSTKELQPNNIHLYWEPTTPFDTSLVGPGNSSVLVNASRTFFDDASCVFIIEVTYTDNELIIYDLAVDAGLFDTYVCQFYFEDQYGNYLEGASIVDVVVSGPTGGLIVNNESFTDLGLGNYSISFTSQLSGTYQVTITAEADFYGPAGATLLLYIGEISTGLEILNGTVGLIPFGQDFRLVLRYANGTGYGIENANITMTSVSPEGGVTAGTTIDEGEGIYSLVLTPLESDDFTILVSANITNYQTQIERFTLSVAPIATDLYTASGNSSASTVFETVYELEMYYVNTQDNLNISSASIQVEFALTETLNWTVEPYGNGYILRIEADELGRWELTITAQKALHQTGVIQFVLFVTENPTLLDVPVIPPSVYIDDISSYVFTYRVEGGAGVVDANVSFTGVDPDWVSFTPLGDGNYNITFEANQTGTFSFNVIFAKYGYQMINQPVTLSVTLIAADLYTASGSSSASVVFGTVYEIELYYANTQDDLNISSALIQVEFTSIEALNWTVAPYGDGYILRIEAYELGRWELTITAQRALHQTGSIQFVLFVTENPTFLDVPVIPSSVYIGNISSYVFAYSIEGGAGVIDANVSFSGIDPDWVSFTPIGDGNYSITIEANQTGTFSFNVIFAKYGYQTVNQPVAFQVGRIPLTIEIAPPTWMVNSDLTFNLTLTDVTGAPVSDAFVNYTITQGDVELYLGLMTEDPDSEGTYIATISQTRVPWTGNQLYGIRISVSKENHQVENQGLQVNIVEFMPPGYEVQIFIQTVVPQVAFFIFALVSIVIGRRMYRTNKRKRAIAILAVKRRFEDIRGILGIIVIHKVSGIAVYSKILKGGFDEGMMSAFITAITHFRSEFEVEEPHWEFNVVPISDIISIVPTRNLLCAFIVGARPTMTLEDRMVGFARAVGAMFDETMAAPPRAVIDDSVHGLFDYLFDDVMDGALLRQYRVKKDVPYPRNQKCLQTYLEAYPPQNGFGLDSLADGMAMCGIREGNIYQQIIDAIEEGILESIDPKENYPGFQKDDAESVDSEPADL